MPRWFLFTVFAVLSWGLWAVISKLIGDALTAPQSQALSTLGLLPVMLALGLSRRLAVIGRRPRGIASALAAGILACAGNVAYYHALNSGARAATVVPLTALYPLLTIALAVLFLREKLNRVQGAGVLLSLAAIYLFNVPSAEGMFSSSLGYAVLPIAFWGVTGFLQKISTNHLSGELSTLWFLTAFIPVAGVILWREPLTVRVPITAWVLAAALGLFFALGNFALLAACASEGKASVVVPLTALYPVVSVPMAIFFFDEKISARETVGIILAVMSVMALAWEKPPPTVQRFNALTL